MRTAKTILTVIQERGKERKPIERVYKLLFNRELYLNAYAKLYPNKGALTKGVTEETADGMSIRKIDRIIELLREEKYRWKPARREYIPKKNGKIDVVLSEELDQSVREQFSDYGSLFSWLGNISGMAGARVLKKLPSQTEIEVMDAPFQTVLDALQKAGKIIEIKEDGASGIVMAGKANMNPAYVIIHQENGKVMVMATAKEGLIKQHTAAGAIGKIRQLI